MGSRNCAIPTRVQVQTFVLLFGKFIFFKVQSREQIWRAGLAGLQAERPISQHRLPLTIQRLAEPSQNLRSPNPKENGLTQPKSTQPRKIPKPLETSFSQTSPLKDLAHPAPKPNLNLVLNYPGALLKPALDPIKINPKPTPKPSLHEQTRFKVTVSSPCFAWNAVPQSHSGSTLG